VHHPIEMADEPKLTRDKICARCGAKISARFPGRSCAACLIETALGGDGEEERSPHSSATPMIMDFGDYELLEEIGRGGQGVVFRARQKSLNRTVALKVIGLGQWSSTPHLKRFRQEAEAAASLEHPQIVPIYEVGERDGSCYFSMKFVEGGQLDEVIKREPMPVRRAVELLVKIARTVHFAHARGILHRDIKPGNILLDKNGEPHLTDFGLARLIEQQSTVTNSFDVLGTPSYMPPEQASGHAKELTSAADVYSLGAVFYQMLTGEPPFAGGTTYETIRLVLEAEPRNPRTRNAKVDVDIATICLKCLEKDPSKRYPNAKALAEDLERWLRHEPVQARRTGLFGRARKWVRRNPTIMALIASLIGLGVLGVVMFLNRQPAAPPSGIAVLPFENLSDNKTDSSWVDGMQDDILTKLAKVAQLKVISRTSVMQYRGERNVRKIGNALRVSHVLEGSVRKTGDRIQLNAQLIDARTDTHVWAEQYDRDLTDVFAIQSELAQKIANQLRAKISGAEKQAIESKPTEDLQAYAMYLRGKQLLRDIRMPAVYDIPKINEAIELLEAAVKRDPNFALAYCLLAEANLVLYWQPPHAPSQRAQAEKALQAARRLAPDAGETHFTRAFFYHYGNRDYHQALGELETAMGLLPNSAEVFKIAGRIDKRLNRSADSIRHYSRALELDPRDSGNFYELGLTYQNLRRYREVEQIADRGIASFPESAAPFWIEKGEAALAEGDTVRARKAMETASSPSWWLLYRISLCERNFAEAERAAAGLAEDKAQSADYPPSFWRGFIARVQGDSEKARSFFAEARQAYERMLRERGEYPEALAFLAATNAFSGQREDALRQIQRAVELMPIDRDPLNGVELLGQMAMVYAWIGERDKAIEQLLAIARLPDIPSAGELRLNPWWDPLRNDPRFSEIVSEAAKPIPLK
jgi:serine/threonine protein kinase/tetratricopeptide (TPR) repeat protein